MRKADDPIESFASILINIAEETVPQTATKSKNAKKPWFTEDCKTAIKQRWLVGCFVVLRPRLTSKVGVVGWSEGAG